MKKMTQKVCYQAARWLLLGGLVFSGQAHATSPTVATGSATSITATGATLNGTVNPNNHSTTADVFNYGLTTGYGATINATPYTITSGSGATPVSAVLTGLTCNTTYDFRVSATNSSGTTNGSNATFTTSACPPPTTTTNAATALTTAGATLNGTVSSNGASTTAAFNYGLTNTYGSTATAAQSPLAAGASGTAVSAAVTGLNCGTLYHFQVSATNSAGTTNGSDLTFTTSVCPAPAVTSINLASVNPTYTATAVAWTVVFNQSVTGVDATDFTLVQAGGVSGASITLVTGSGTTWTVNANTGSGGGTLGLNLVDNDSIVNGSGTPLGGVGAGNGNFTGQVYTISTYCSAPSNIPAGVTVSCVCDQFGRANLNPSTIYGGNWVVSTSDTTGVVPYINAGTGHLRLTENTGNNAKAATVPSIFPAAGNYISVEFQHYAYSGNGADGIAVTLSDYSVPAVPGAFGGSLGYAQKNQASCGVTGGCPGFAGGWLGVALDEFGNYQNPTEGRILGPGVVTESVGLRGPGSGLNGYEWMGGTASSPGGLTVDNHASSTPAPGYMYQVVVDARNSASGTVNVSVNRDSTTKDGTSYTSLFGPFNAYTEASNAVTQGWITQVVPNFWQISFTGSTGGSTNIHEIGSLRICAQSVSPTTGGTASGFNAIDSAYGTPPLPVQDYLTGHIYTKVVNKPFNLNVAALSNNQIVTTYALSSAQTVTVNLVDNSDSLSNPALDCTLSCSSTCKSKSAITGGTQTLSFAKGAGDQGQKQSPAFTVNSAYQKLVAIISDGTTTACSTDAFAVRPQSIATVTSSNATNSGTSGGPTFKAGSDVFSLTATTTGVAGYPSGYNGVIKINNAAVQPASPATTKGAITGTFPAATPGTPSSTATGNSFTYSEVGAFMLPGYDPATDTTTKRSVYDGVAIGDECTTPAQCDLLRPVTWTGVDSISSKGDCVQGSYANSMDTSGTFASNLNFGKYGCIFGLLPNSVAFGRFIPDHFDTVITPGMPCPTGLTCPTLAITNDQGFVYSGEPFTATVTALNAAGATTLNYDGALGLSKDTTLSTYTALGGSTATSGGTLNNGIIPASAFSKGSATLTPNFTFSTSPTAPMDIYLRAMEASGGDGVTSLRATPSSSVEGGIKIASGQVNVSNAYGSELLPLSLTATVQYYNAAGSWVTSTTDSVDTVTAAKITRQTCQGALLSGGTCSSTLGTISSVVSVPSTPPPYGVFSINLAAPGQGNTGSEDLIVNLLWPAWLPSNIGRATFGVYGGSSGSNNFIYQRETY